MDAKLTLKLNQEVIEKAKKYASEKQLSLSRLIENYLSSLTKELKNEDDIKISPFVKSLSTGVKIPTGIEDKKEYQNYLSEKYQ